MITAGDVKADVIDIVREHNPPERIAVDANVLYFVYYPNFHFFDAAGMSVPHQSANSFYSRYLEWLGTLTLPPRNAGEPMGKVQICTAGQIIGEFR